MVLPLCICCQDNSKSYPQSLVKSFVGVGCITGDNWLDYGGADTGIFKEEFLPLWYISNAELYSTWVHWPWGRFALYKFFCSSLIFVFNACTCTCDISGI